MADEDLTPDGVEGEDTRPVETGEELPKGDSDDQAITLEEAASELGWSPKDQWRGDPEEWQPASAFLKNTVAINKAERRARKNLEDRLSRISRTTDAMLERVRADERAKVEAEFAAAVDEGDHDRARQASAKLQSLSSETTDKAPIADFETRNAEWWQVDPLATQMAINVSNIAAGQGKSPDEQLKLAEDAVRKRFPEYFGDAKPKSKGPAEVAEQQGRTARTTSSNRQRGFNDLPPEAKAVALKLEKQGVKKESYAEEYWKENA